ncbi:MAG: aspartate/ornithine carbamoyltransferase family protein [bacterium JZ-2024 1]
MGLLKKDLCDTTDLSDSALQMILARAQEVERQPLSRVLTGRKIALMFLEPSTRTRISFQMAAEALGAQVVIVDPQTSSVQKGETLLDTVKTLEAEGVHYLVVRCSTAFLPHLLARETRMHVINGGDGQHAHPTQALADVLALARRVAPTQDIGPPSVISRILHDIRILFTGDVRHSRVFRSSADLFRRCGAQIGIATYPTLSCEFCFSFEGTQKFHTLESGLSWADVVYPLRVQKERLADLPFASTEEYYCAFGVKSLRKHQWLMHCGPFNRGVEVSSALVYSEQSLIGDQVRCGYLTRVALLAEMEAES